MSRRHLLAASYWLLGILAVTALVGGALSGGRTTTLSLCISAVHSTVVVACLVVTVSFVVGVGGAALAALGPPTFDVVLSRAVEVASALPSVVVVAVLASVARTSPMAAIGTFLALKHGLESARILRAELLQLAAEDFVLAARATGASHFRLFRRHYLPHVSRSAFSRATLGAGAVVSLDAAGSFLGVFPIGGGWGGILAEALRRSSPLLFLWPALGTAITVAALVVVSDAIADKGRLGRRFLS
jgi:ABC-type dipeptide/oligopeptide/nickel transport system permease subunit